MTRGVPSPLRARMAGAAVALMSRPPHVRGTGGSRRHREHTGAPRLTSEDGASLRELRHPRPGTPPGAPGLHGSRPPRGGQEHRGEPGTVVHLLHHAVPPPVIGGVATIPRAACPGGNSG